MLVADQFERLQRWPMVRLFATDLDTAALTKARRGLFAAAALAEVPPHLAKKYLSVTEESFQIVKRVRDMVIFSEHNLLHDPAFLRLDLISCRNLLIYLQPQVQYRVLKTFAHALKPAGLLFLGKAEALYANADLFSVIHAAGHLYRSNGGVDWQSVATDRPSGSVLRLTEPRATPPRAWSVGDWLTHAHVAGVLAPLVLVDDRGHLAHVFGDVTPYLRLGAGLATLDLLQLAIEPIRLELRSLLLHALHQSNQRVSTEVVLDEGARRLSLIAMRREEVEGPALTLVLFDVHPSTPVAAGDGDAQAEHTGLRRALEDQLTATREHLSTVINELESTNEELQSLNEEMQSANEELQSANEELETSNEELQSTNEELITVNEELESRTAELSLLNADLKNVKNSLVDPIIVVDEHRRVTLFNPPAVQLFALDASSIGSLLFSLPCHVDVGDASSLVNEVIRSGDLAERQLSGERSHLMRVQPYRSTSGERKGAVLTFHDNTELLNGARALEAAHRDTAAAERFARATIDALPHQVGVIDAMGQLVSVNARWRTAVAEGCLTTRACLEGVNLLAALQQAERRGDPLAAELAAGMGKVLAGELDGFDLEYPGSTLPDALHFHTTLTPFGTAAESRHWVVTHEDITLRKRMEARMRLKGLALQSTHDAIAIADAQHPDMPLIFVNKAFEQMTGYSADEVMGLNCRFLQGTDTHQAALLSVRTGLARHETVRALLRNYRKDGAMFWNELTIAPMFDEGRLTHFVGLQRDVTALLAGEEALRSSLQRESRALAFAGLGSLELDIRSGRVALSERHARLLGLAGDVRALEVGELRHMVRAEDQALFDDSIKLCVARHQGLDIEYRVQWADGTVHWLHTQGNAELDERGTSVRLLAPLAGRERPQGGGGSGALHRPP